MTDFEKLKNEVISLHKNFSNNVTGKSGTFVEEEVFEKIENFLQEAHSNHSDYSRKLNSIKNSFFEIQPNGNL